VVKHATAAEAYRVERRVTEAIVAFVGVTVVVAGAIGVAFGFTTLSALRRLSSGAEAIGRGEYDVDFETPREDEFGTVFGSLARMRDALRARIAALDDANQRLEEQRVVISVLNRMLRHNMRNEMNLVRGYARRIVADSDDDGVVEDAERVDRIADGLVRQAAKARRVEALLDHDHVPSDSVDLVPLVEATVDHYREVAPEVRFAVETPSEASVYGCEQVQVALDNLVENAVEHGCGAVDPRTQPDEHQQADGGDGRSGARGGTADAIDGRAEVRVSVSTDGDAVEVRVADDGPGIPEHEVLAIGDEETALEHGSGLGLWVTDIVVSHVDGDLSFERGPDGGTVVTVRLYRPASGS
jgi:signal transduction histidine kinase